MNTDGALSGENCQDHGDAVGCPLLVLVFRVVFNCDENEKSMQKRISHSARMKGLTNRIFCGIITPSYDRVCTKLDSIALPISADAKDSKNAGNVRESEFKKSMTAKPFVASFFRPRRYFSMKKMVCQGKFFIFDKTYGAKGDDKQKKCLTNKKRFDIIKTSEAHRLTVALLMDQN